MRIGGKPDLTGQVERLTATGAAWPISGDGITRSREGIGPGGLIGMLAPDLERADDFEQGGQ